MTDLLDRCIECVVWLVLAFLFLAYAGAVAITVVNLFWLPEHRVGLGVILMFELFFGAIIVSAWRPRP